MTDPKRIRTFSVVVVAMAGSVAGSRGIPTRMGGLDRMAGSRDRWWALARGPILFTHVKIRHGRDRAFDVGCAAAGGHFFGGRGFVGLLDLPQFGVHSSGGRVADVPWGRGSISASCHILGWGFALWLWDDCFVVTSVS
jgi:hypothetical protein